MFKHASPLPFDWKQVATTKASSHRGAYNPDTDRPWHDDFITGVIEAPTDFSLAVETEIDYDWNEDIKRLEARTAIQRGLSEYEQYVAEPDFPLVGEFVD